VVVEEKWEGVGWNSVQWFPAVDSATKTAWCYCVHL